MAYAQFAPDGNGLSNEAPPPIGHNRAPSKFFDPGPATDFVDRGPAGVLIEPRKLRQFHDAICSQGSADIRQAALSNADARVRSDRSVGHLAYRFWAQILSRVRWEYRYHCEPMQTAAHFSASDPKNARRQADELVSSGYLCRIDLPRPSGGRPMPCYTVVCTAEDRSGETLEILKREAKRRSIACDVQDDDPNRHHDDLQTVPVTSSPSPNRHGEDSIRHEEGLQTVTMTAANRHHDAHTVDITVERDCRDSEVSASADKSPHAREPELLIIDKRKPPKRKGRANGMKKWAWLPPEQRDALLEQCIPYAAERAHLGWTPEFLRDRLKAFLLHQEQYAPASLNWAASLEQWLAHPRFQPRTGRSSGRKSFIEFAEEREAEQIHQIDSIMNGGRNGIR